MTILVGTASWADKSLVDSGKFYPPDVTSPEARLRYYASQFPMVEVDSSYYAMPLPVTTQQWAERTPVDFVFNVKAFRLFTGHQAQPRVLPKDIQEALGLPLHQNVYYRDLPEEIQKELWSRFFQALQPLHAAGKLGAIHFQFAPWITSGGEPRQLRPLLQAAVELRLGEKRTGQLQNLVGPAQFLDLALEILDALSLGRSHALPSASIDLRTLDPFEQRLRHAANPLRNQGRRQANEILETRKAA